MDQSMIKGWEKRLLLTFEAFLSSVEMLKKKRGRWGWEDREKCGEGGTLVKEEGGKISWSGGALLLGD